MTTRSVQDHIKSLLERRVVEQRTQGASAPDVEAASLFESIAISLLLNPRAVLYSALLARNGLLSLARQELATIASLRSAIQDLGNVSFAVTDTKALEKAKVSLLQLEGQERMDATGPVFKRFDSAVSDFLEKQLAKNVRRPGSSALVRPGAEAASDLPSVSLTLKEEHQELLDRLYALSVGVENFLTTPLSTILGLSTSSRVRADIQAIIDSLQADPSASISRDAAVRLVAARSALRTLGTPPNIAEPIVDTNTSLPRGMTLSAYSADKAPAALSSAGPWVMPVAANAVVQVGVSLSASFFPQTTIDHQNAAYVVGDTREFPVVFQNGEALFLRFTAQAAWSSTFVVQTDGTYSSTDAALGSGWLLVNGEFVKTVRVVLGNGWATSTHTKEEIISLVDSAIGSLGQMLEYVQAGTNRLYIRGEPAFIKRVTIDTSATSPSGSTVKADNLHTKSAHDSLGFYIGQFGVEGTTDARFIEDAGVAVFGPLASVGRAPDGKISVTSIESEPETELILSGTAFSTMSLAGSYKAVTDTIFLEGDVLGVATDPVSPISLMDIGDRAVTPTGEAQVIGLAAGSFQVSSALTTFAGPITVRSAVHESWSVMDKALQAFVDDFVATPFAIDLKKLDAVLAPLTGSSNAAQRNMALNVLVELETQIQALIASLTLPTSFLPAGAGSKERVVVNGIVQALTERKFDRALQMLLRCRIQEMFELDWQTASFSGAMLQAASNMARTDLRFPNRAVGDDGEVKAVLDRTGSTS